MMMLDSFLKICINRFVRRDLQVLYHNAQNKANNEPCRLILDDFLRHIAQHNQRVRIQHSLVVVFRRDDKVRERIDAIVYFHLQSVTSVASFAFEHTAGLQSVL